MLRRSGTSVGTCQLLQAETLPGLVGQLGIIPDIIEFSPEHVAVRVKVVKGQFKFVPTAFPLAFRSEN